MARQVVRYVPTSPTEVAAARTAPGRARRQLTRMFVMVLAVASLVAVPLVRADAVTRPRTLHAEAAVGAAPVTPGFPIDYVSVLFDLPPGVEAHPDHLAVRFRHGDDWGAWQHMEEDGAQALGSWTGALLAGDDADAYQVRGLPSVARNARAAAVNTTDGPRVVVGHRPVGAAEASTPCRSRSDWGADEGLRSSTRSYAPVQVLTVHHTGTDTADAEADPDALVRAIYSVHTQSNGWDDIGYQALIAPDGTLYEGRWSGSTSRSCLHDGGDGRDFGHQTTDPTASVVTGAHTGGHNTGNYGVAVLGTYTDAAPAVAARDALVAHLAELAARHGLDPTGTVAYDNGTNAGDFATISSHRDFVATLCPGGVLYADLPAVRTDVATLLDGSEPPPDPEEPPADEVVASGEQAVRGTVEGTYLATTVRDGAAQSVTEVESGGKPSRRHAELEHTWFLDGPVATPATLVVEASATVSGDGDGFTFEVSTDGTSWVAVLTVAAGSDGSHSGPLPADLTGPVRVRVVDTVRTAGAASVDTVTVDHLAVVAGGSGSSEPPPPAEDGALTLTASASKVKGEHVVDLAWVGATKVVVHRDAASFVVDGSTFSDHIGAKGAATYNYRVCDRTDPTACSPVIQVTF